MALNVQTQERSGDTEFPGLLSCLQDMDIYEKMTLTEVKDREQKILFSLEKEKENLALHYQNQGGKRNTAWGQGSIGRLVRKAK